MNKIDNLISIYKLTEMNIFLFYIRHARVNAESHHFSVAEAQNSYGKRHVFRFDVCATEWRYNVNQ